VIRVLAWVFGIYLVWINGLAFLCMGADKRRARRGAWRIPERLLFMLVTLGGGVGGILGMVAFRHKTRHWYFVWGFPLIVAAEAAALYFLWEVWL